MDILCFSANVRQCNIAYCVEHHYVQSQLCFKSILFIIYTLLATVAVNKLSVFILLVALCGWITTNNKCTPTDSKNYA